MSGLLIRQMRGAGVDVDLLHVERGHCIALHGASGSGKTRLLRAIADLDPVDGEVRLDGQSRKELPAPVWRHHVMYLAAESHWWASSVREHSRKWVPDQLAALGFEMDVLDWPVHRLSSGERQRLALARALARSPEVLLLDEPTANLDSTNTAQVERLIASWLGDTHCALWVSHDPAQRRRVAETQHLITDGRLSPANDD